MRGLRVALVEQYDFAYGTSSRSSRLLHGGLRYLAQGRIGLVREAGREKRVLQRIAPHLAQPLAFVFPTYKGTTLVSAQAGHRREGVRPAVRRQRRPSIPMAQSSGCVDVGAGLNAVRLTGAVRYGDGLTNDARLVMDTLRSAAQHGALLFNYMRFAAAVRSAQAWSCTFARCLVRSRAEHYRPLHCQRRRPLGRPAAPVIPETAVDQGAYTWSSTTTGFPFPTLW